MSQIRGPSAQQRSGEPGDQYPHLATVLLDSIPTSALILDRTLRVALANRNFLEKAHRTAENTLNRRLEEVFPPAILNYTQLDQRARVVLASNRSYEGGKMTYRAPGMMQRVYYYSLTPLRDVEAVTGVLLLMHDITEQERLTEDVRRVERHLASVVESANELIVSMDPDGRIMTWNQAAERLSGSRAADVAGRNLADLCAHEERAEMAHLLASARLGEPSQVREVCLQVTEDHRIPMAWTCSPMLDDQDRVVGLVAVGRDLTERRQLEAQLFQSAKMASLGVMAGGIAHELRNPLGVASAAAQLLLRESEDRDFARICAQKIYDGIKRASGIIESLLRFARPSSNRFDNLEMADVLTDMMALMGHQANLQQVEVTSDIAPDLPLIHGDRSALQQVFSNLFLNGCQAMPDGGRLHLRAYALPGEPRLTVEISDTGAGIPAEHLGKVFDPFFTTRPAGQGVGLGLTITYSILQQHGGDIEVHSRVGSGTTFTVRLPTAPQNKV
jgi:PAS domain S-box-containing protein